MLSLVLEIYMLLGRKFKIEFASQIFSSFTIFGKEKIEDRSSIMIDAKETKIERQNHVQVHLYKKHLLETMTFK
jgi:hypothetical protein